jgi:cytochrome b6-f complex iron-sulfur subunit
MELTRREALRSGWRLGGALLAFAAGWTGWEALRPLAASSKGAKINVGNLSQYGDGTATYVPEGRLYVVNAKGTIFALSQKCPHLGCRVQFCDSSGRFECACHGSVYDIAGEYVHGPAPRGMDRYTGLKADGSNLIVDTATLTNGPDRGAAQYLTPAKGPSCAQGV